mmetsp:Transcript_74815/g.175622  ORF Transcript_74815/g.175622 Transcript_74815/m.175622 type:complete len:294 (+) Transcript_74815:1391-2272(+)
MLRVALLQASLESPTLGGLPAPVERAAAMAKWITLQDPPLDIVALQGVSHDGARSKLLEGFKGRWVLSEVGKRDLFPDSGFLIACTLPILHSEWFPFSRLGNPGGVHRGVLALIVDISSRVDHGRLWVFVTLGDKDPRVSWDTIYPTVADLLGPSRDDYTTSPTTTGALLFGALDPFPSEEDTLGPDHPPWLPEDICPTDFERAFTFDPVGNELAGVVASSGGHKAHTAHNHDHIATIEKAQCSGGERQFMHMECLDASYQPTGSTPGTQTSDHYAVIATLRPRPLPAPSDDE